MYVWQVCRDKIKELLVRIYDLFPLSLHQYLMGTQVASQLIHSRFYLTLWQHGHCESLSPWNNSLDFWEYFCILIFLLPHWLCLLVFIIYFSVSAYLLNLDILSGFLLSSFLVHFLPFPWTALHIPMPSIPMISREASPVQESLTLVCATHPWTSHFRFVLLHKSCSLPSSASRIKATL